MLALLLTALLACAGSKDDTPTDTDIDSGGVDSSSTERECDAGTDPTPGSPGCAAAGGVCVGSELQCSGTIAAEHDDECSFDDGDGLCCVPPAANATGDTCAAQGGTCAPIGGCGKVDGWMAESSDCEAVNEICCVPEATCDGQESLACCYYDASTGAPMTQYEPLCDRGTVTCFEGTTLTCVEECAVR